MTRLKSEKIKFILILLFLIQSSFLWGSQRGHSASIYGFSMGIVPLYHFSIEPEGETEEKYLYSGTSISLYAGHRIGRATVRLGFFWNMLFLTGDDRFEVLHMTSPYLHVLFRLKYNFYGGTGIAGVFIPGSEKLGALVFDTRFDLWFTLLAGYNFPVSKYFDIFTEINYSLNITHRQWAEGKRSDGTRQTAYTRSAHLLTLYCGIKLPF